MWHAPQVMFPSIVLRCRLFWNPLEFASSDFLKSCFRWAELSFLFFFSLLKRIYCGDWGKDCLPVSCRRGEPCENSAGLSFVEDRILHISLFPESNTMPFVAWCIMNLFCWWKLSFWLSVIVGDAGGVNYSLNPLSPQCPPFSVSCFSYMESLIIWFVGKIPPPESFFVFFFFLF